MVQRLVAVALLCVFATPALGGGPKAERIAGHDTLAKGTLEGLSLDTDGVLRLGPVYDDLALDADSAWTAAQAGDAIWIGTGNESELLRVRGDSIQRTKLGEGLMVTAVAALPDGSCAAAVFPGGRIYKVTAGGKAALHASLNVEHVWALHADARGALTVACGVPGSVHRIDPFGAPAKLADVDDEHARCLAVRGKTTYVGTSPKGRVLALENNKTRVVRDLEPQEVVGIVPLDDGGLVIAANADQAGGNAQAIASLLRQIAEPSATKPGKKPAARASLQDGSIVHLEPSGVLTTLWSKKKVALLSLSATKDGAVAGTYPSGRVVHVAPGGASALLADLPEAEASVVLGDAAVVTSNPAVLHRRKAAVNEGAWISAPVDGGAPSAWGRVSLWGNGIKALHARQGETKEPDDSWSAWKPVTDFDGRGGVIGANARFVQLKAVLAGAGASMRAVEIVTRTPNRAPVLSALTMKKPGTKKGAPPPVTPKREIGWKATDADGDTLRTTIEVNRRGSPHWAKLVDGKVLKKTAHTWDTTGAVDGIYQVRVTVDDAQDNEPARVRKATRLYVGLRVDNTAPTASVKARRMSGGKLAIEGSATDANDGRIVRVRVSIDGGDWVALGASDGLFDGSREAFEAILRFPDGGAHDIVVQATDADGNVGSAATVVR